MVGEWGGGEGWGRGLRERVGGEGWGGGHMKTIEGSSSYMGERDG